MRSWMLSFLLVWAIGISAQHLHFNQHEISVDLLRSNPTCLYRHHNGVIHIGTQEGLVDFDGLNKDEYLRSDGGSEHVTALFHDGATLWVGYEDGAIFHLNNQSLTPWIIQEGWPKSKITDIVRDKAGQYWISTYGEGIYVFADQVLYNIDSDDGLGSADIYSMVSDKKGQIYVATDSGIFVCRFANGQKKVSKLSFSAEVDSDVIQEIKLDPIHQVLYGTSYDDGIWQLDLNTKSATKINGLSGNIGSFDHNNGHLIASKNDKSESKLFQVKAGITQRLYADGLEGDLSITQTMLDEEGTLWVLCKNNGLLSADASFVTYPSTLFPTQAVLKIGPIIYLGDENGLFRTNEKGETNVLIKDENILSLFHAVFTNEIWAGTFGNGIFIIDIATGKIKNINESSGLINNNVFSIAQHQNDVWVSTLAGLQQISQYGEFKKSWNKKTGLRSDYNYTLFADSKDNLWIGTDGKGLAYMDRNNQLTTLGDRETVISITEDAKGRIWFCNLDKGLGFIENGKITPFGLEKGLSELHISGITSDNKGNILAFHHTGIDVIDSEKLTVLCIGNNIGIRKWDQNINAFYKDKSGSIILTHKDKWIAYEPKQHKIAHPTLFIKSVMCGQVKLPYDETIVLAYDQNDFQVEYAGIWMNDPKAVTYRYKMEPLDTEWRYTKDLKLIYANLPAGKYKFDIQCGINQQFFTSSTGKWTFTIKAAFWQTWWFYLAIVLAIIGLIMWWSETKNKRSKLMQQMQTEQVKSQLETLKSQINPHFLFNSFNTLISTIEKEPKEAVVFVEKLSDFYRSMLQYRDTDLITLQEELEIQENYRFLLFQRFRQNLNIKVDISDSKMIYLVPLTLQILTENAVKHNIVSATKPLEITITREGDQLKVCNNLQVRLTAEKSTHFGLQSLSRRYLSITGKEIQVEQTEKYFCVTIPLIKV